MDSTESIAVDGPSSCPTNIRPPVTTFSPSMWGDTFMSYSVDDQVQERYAEAIQELKEEVRRTIIADGNTKTEILILIDTLERLGVAYHFEQEIGEKLEQILKSDANLNMNKDEEDCDLFTIALEFRLFRRHRYHVSCGIFEKFIDEDKKFKETLNGNIEALLSFYEATQVRIHGEDILEEAVVFTTHHLNRLVQHLGLIWNWFGPSPLQDKVMRALKQSFHRGVPRIETRHFISIYEKDESNNESLLKLAKLDFNYLQNLYKKELFDLSRWWNEFDLKSKLSYARDRLVECYFWGMAFHFEPQYSFVRSAVAKSMQLASIVDDTYDNYASLEEAELFTECLERWDINEIDRLPDYMQIVYKHVLDTYEVFEIEASTRERSFAFAYAKESVKQLGRAYLKELKWFLGRQMPNFEEYFSNTVITSCIYLMFSASFIGMESASKETSDWLFSRPNMVVATAKLGRYVEDLGSHERENKGGQMLTAVECYMKQHGSSKQETLSKFIEHAEEGWKDVNAERLNIGSSIPKDIVELFLNYTRVADITYKNCEDGYTYPEKFLAHQIVSVLLDPIIL
ncbi:hypothetical protein ACJIZ3_006082 [Penstemon smallii]|uniref:Uncharacterized protein n=1 Tax=Penstemon smallii TaxID=265156 RepID=A0ABD3S705_9LAMI